MEQLTKVRLKDKVENSSASAEKLLVNARQRFALTGFIGLNLWVLLSLRHDGLLLAQILPACLIISCVLLLKAFQR